MKRGSKTLGSPGRSRPSSAKSSRELWLSAVNSTGGSPGAKKPHVGKRSPEEYWTDTLRRSGIGISTESTGMDTMTGLRKSQKNMAYSSTSHYLRQVVGTEKGKKGAADPTSKAAPGTPMYKSQEEYYEEILGLKKEIVGIKNENSTMKSKIRRLEEDNLKKEREIEQLLDPSKSDEMRRTLADRKPDTGTVIHSLKQKILKLEHQVRDKEAALAKIQSDLKTTKVDELRTQLDVFHQEIVRLNQAKNMGTDTVKPAKPATVKESPSKVKALQETILRMNEKNLRLTTENRSLKEDLEKAMEDAAHTKTSNKEYGDMNRKELLATVAKLQKKVDRADVDAHSLHSDLDSKQGSTTQGKITLEGNVNQKLTQLDRRETELLEELEKQKGVVKRLQDDRDHYRKKAEQKEKEIKALKKEIEELRADMEQQGVTPRRTPRARPPSGRRSPGSVSSSKRSRSPTDREMEREKQRRVQEFVENRAARHIQREWRGHKQREEEHKRKEVERLKERDQKIRKFQENHAAKVIQQHWVDHQHQKQQQEDATEFLQSAMRGHLERRNQMPHIGSSSRHTEITPSEVTESDLDSAAEVVQSAVRGHISRKELIKRGYHGHQSPRSSGSRSGGRRTTRLDSAGEEEDSDISPGRRGSGRRPPSGRLSLTGSGKSDRRMSPPPRLSRTAPSPSDDDSDIAPRSRGGRTKIF